MKSIIPNSLTTLNLFCGCLAVLAFLGDENILGIILVFIASVADFLDGFVARLLGVQSELGKQLDSLADMISFGFVPGIILFKALIGYPLENDYMEALSRQQYIPLLGFLITIFSGIRLAKFNIDTRQSNSFIGLPTPANTLFFITIPLIWINETPSNWIYKLTLDKNLLVGLTIFFSYLLIAEIPLLALKFKGFRVKINFYRYLLLVLSLLLILTLKYRAIPFILTLYILLSLLNNISERKNKI